MWDYRKRWLTRRPKTMEIPIISRKGQPEPIAEVKRLKKKDIDTPVSSSWISRLSYDAEDNSATMTTYKFTKGGISYHDYTYPNFPFKLFEGWIYAHSKGSYWWRNVNGRVPLLSKGEVTEAKADILAKEIAEGKREPYYPKYMEISKWVQAKTAAAGVGRIAMDIYSKIPKTTIKIKDIRLMESNKMFRKEELKK